MWSKVSGSDSVWVNTKDLLFPFFTPTPNPHTPFLHHTPTTTTTHPFPKIYEGNVWIWLALWTRCQTTSEKLCWGSRLHGDVFLSSPCSSFSSWTLLLALLHFLSSPPMRCWKWPLTDMFLLSALHWTLYSCSPILQPHVHPRFIPFMYSADWLLSCSPCGWGSLWDAEWWWPRDSFNQEWDAERMKKHKWIDEHGKRGDSIWPFEFKHMSDVVRTCQSGKKKTGTDGMKCWDTLVRECY